MPRNSAIPCLGGTLTDVDHAGDPAAAFLVSSAASMISGQTIVVDGGISAHGGPWGSMNKLW